MLGEGEITRYHDELAPALRDIALPKVPRIQRGTVHSEYRDVKRSWGCRRLWRGTERRAISIVEDNLLRYQWSRPDLQGFSFATYSDQKCAQVNVHLGDGGPWGTFLGFRIWRCAGTSDVFLCGPRDAQFYGPGAWPERTVRYLRGSDRSSR